MFYNWSLCITPTIVYAVKQFDNLISEEPCTEAVDVEVKGVTQKFEGHTYLKIKSI